MSGCQSLNRAPSLLLLLLFLLAFERLACVHFSESESSVALSRISVQAYPHIYILLFSKPWPVCVQLEELGTCLSAASLPGVWSQGSSIAGVCVQQERSAGLLRRQVLPCILPSGEHHYLLGLSNKLNHKLRNQRVRGSGLSLKLTELK